MKYASYILLLFCALLVCPTPARGAEKARRILIDSVHSRSYLDIEYVADGDNYHAVHAYKEVFRYLRTKGVEVRDQKEGPITEKDLGWCTMLFLNLVSGDMPPFTQHEIDAIDKFVRGGGSFFVIVDHSNCYNHTDMLLPLFNRLGVKLYRETAADRYPNTLGTGNGWAIITRFRPHPVTRGLREVVLQAGGCVDQNHAVGTLSSSGWGDFWTPSKYGESKDRGGNFGNWKQDPGERNGALGVIMAADIDKGKMVVVGDQNIFGDLWLKYADNYVLFFNAAAWLLDRPDIADRRAYENSRQPRILLFDDYRNPAFGSMSPTGCYSTFHELSREYWTFASNHLDTGFGLLMFPPNRFQMTPAQMLRARLFLGAGGRMIFLAVKGRLEKTNTLAMNQITKGLKPLRAEEKDKVRTVVYEGGGVITTVLNGERYTNAVLCNPRGAPTPEQTAQAERLRALIKKCLPPGQTK